MFESIEQLEQEIELFRQNILASATLLDSLDALVSAVRKQNDDFKSASSKLISKMDSHASDMKQTSGETLYQMATELDQCTIELREIVNQAVSRIDSNNKQSLKETIEQFRSSQQAYIKKLESINVTLETLRSSNEKISRAFSEKCDSTIVEMQAMIDRLSTGNKTHLDSAAAQIATVQTEYIKSLQSTETAMQSLSADLKQRYNEFLTRLEETNMNQIYQACLDMKKSIETKLIFATAVAGIAAIAAVISIIVK